MSQDYYETGPYSEFTIPRDWENPCCSKCKKKRFIYKPSEYCIHQNTKDASTCQNYTPPVTEEIRMKNEMFLKGLFQDELFQQNTTIT